MVIVIAALVGSVPVNASQSLATITPVGDIPDVTSTANEAAALCDAGQAATSDTNEGLSLLMSVNMPHLVDALYLVVLVSLMMSMCRVIFLLTLMMVCTNKYSHCCKKLVANNCQSYTNDWYYMCLFYTCYQ